MWNQIIYSIFSFLMRSKYNDRRSINLYVGVERSSKGSAHSHLSSQSRRWVRFSIGRFPPQSTSVSTRGAQSPLFRSSSQLPCCHSLSILAQQYHHISHHVWNRPVRLHQVPCSLTTCDRGDSHPPFAQDSSHVDTETCMFCCFNLCPEPSSYYLCPIFSPMPRCCSP